MGFLEASVAGSGTEGEALDYYVTSSQVRFIASKGPASVVKFSPTMINPEEDNVMLRNERSTSAAIGGTIGLPPSVELNGSFIHTSGEERVHRRWAVMGTFLPSEIAKTPTILWRYWSNTALHSQLHGNVFEPLPSAIFGDKEALLLLPCLEVEVVTIYSYSPPRRNILARVVSRLTRNKPLPAFRNFLHQNSVLVDLEKTAGNSQWAGNLIVSKEYQMTELGRVTEAVSQQATTRDGTPADSECVFTLKAALHGRIKLTEQQKKKSVLLLNLPNSLIIEINTRYQSTIKTSPNEKPGLYSPSSLSTHRATRATHTDANTNNASSDHSTTFGADTKTINTSPDSSCTTSSVGSGHSRTTFGPDTKTTNTSDSIPNRTASSVDSHHSTTTSTCITTGSVTFKFIDVNNTNCLVDPQRSKPCVAMLLGQGVMLMLIDR